MSQTTQSHGTASAPSSTSFEEKEKSTSEVTSVSDFIDKIVLLNKEKEAGGEIFYRGHADESWELKPSIFRKPNGVVEERQLFRDMVAYTPHSFSECKSALDYLVQMQHYELPTRLLDVSTNPLVALYFACEPVKASASEKNEKNEKDEKGKVYVFSVRENRIKHYDSDTASILANLAKCEYEEIGLPLDGKDIFFYEELTPSVESPKPGACSREHWKYIVANMPTHGVRSNYLKWFNEQASIQILLHQIRGEKPHFQPLLQPCELANIFLVKAKHGNPRIINQAGAFFIFGLGLEYGKEEDGKPLCLSKDVPDGIPSEWIKHEFTISKCNKEKILSELALLGITESYIYPGMTQYAKELKKKYKLS
jgi:FRG domain protein